MSWSGIEQLFIKDGAREILFLRFNERQPHIIVTVLVPSKIQASIMIYLVQMSELLYSIRVTSLRLNIPKLSTQAHITVGLINRGI